MEDTRITIALNIDDPNVLINYCYIDKFNKKICSKKYFWEQVFTKYNIPMLNNYNNVDDWVDEFVRTYNSTIKVEKIIDKISDTNTFYASDFTMKNVDIHYILDIFKKYEYNYKLPKEIQNVLNDGGIITVNELSLFLADDKEYIVQVILNSGYFMSFNMNKDKLYDILFDIIYDNNYKQYRLYITKNL